MLDELREFTPVFNAIVREHGLVVAAVHGRMWRFAQMSDGLCTASHDRIAADMGLSRRTIMRSVRVLVKAGLLVDTTSKRGRVSHAYRVLNGGLVSQSEEPNGDRKSPLGQVNSDRESPLTVTQGHTKIEEKRKNNRSPSGSERKAPPPAVEVFREVMKRYPLKALFDMIDERVGRREDDLRFWRNVVFAWLGSGWNPANVTGMLDCFERRELPSTGRKGRGTNHAGNGRDTSWARSDGAGIEAFIAASQRD